MRIQSKLCHISDNKAVVRVNGWLNDKKLGSALAEGSTVENAEDKAISRLNKRLNINDNDIKSINENNIINKLNHVKNKSEEIDSININREPIDWSNELAAIDIEINRLNWNRNDEIKFLEKTFGYNDRNKITKYEEIRKYLTQLKKIENFDSAKKNIKNTNQMIEESDRLLRDLSWDYKQGRKYLMKEFNVSTRKELNQEQLISFVTKLKSIRNHN